MGIQSNDLNMDDELEGVANTGAEMTFENRFASTLANTKAAFPDCEDDVENYFDVVKTRLMSDEFAHRIQTSFGHRIDNDGSGTLSFEEVKSLIPETLHADSNLWGLSVPLDVTV